ncbi:hypothetical protein [Caulobacter hibisci]|uniref:Uncharacterized protein n=1 Tax=Caulobacter hibisci TaxID=2035993 RepID=A0ABS0T2H0_9CAUL|nr:hypothetical protein [Caulobacter hibisci]MBI1685093.1 hypothetical protein [Caulobacter hibisci]
MSQPASKPPTRKTARASKASPGRIGRSPITGTIILAPYPKKGGMAPEKIRAIVDAMLAAEAAQKAK